MGRLRNHPWIALALAGVVSLVALLVLWRMPGLATVIGGVPAFLAPYVSWVILFRDEARKLLAEAIGHAFYWSKRGQRVAIGTALEADLASASSVLRDESPGLFDHTPKVKWYRTAAAEPEIRDGEAILPLKDFRARKSNAIRVVTAYVRLSALQGIGQHLHQDVALATEYAIAEKLLRAIDRGAAEEYISSAVLPACRASASLAELVDQTRVLDQQGVFTRVALREFIELGRRLGGGLPSAGAARASHSFVCYLHKIATKMPTEDLGDDLGFRSDVLAIGLVLVARPQVFAAQGTAAYTRRVGLYGTSGTSIVYLAARNSNVEYAKEVARDLEGHGNVSSIEEHEFMVQRDTVVRPAYLARVELNPYLSRRAERRFKLLRPATGVHSHTANESEGNILAS